MKKIFKYTSLITIAAIALNGCQKESIEKDTLQTEQEQIISTVSVDFYADNNKVDSKVSLETENDKEFKAEWIDGDELLIDYSWTESGQKSTTAVWNGERFIASEMECPQGPTNWEYVATYPAPGDNGIPFSANRTQDGAGYNGQYDVMKSDVVKTEEQTVGKDKDGQTIVFNMNRLTSILYFHITTTGFETGVNLTKAVFTVEKDGAVIATDNVTINTEGEDPTLVDGVDGKSNSITLTTVQDISDVKLWFNILPCALDKETKATLQLFTSDNKTITLTLPANPQGTTYGAGELHKAVIGPIPASAFTDVPNPVSDEAFYTLEFISDGKNASYEAHDYTYNEIAWSINANFGENSNGKKTTVLVGGKGANVDREFKSKNYISGKIGKVIIYHEARNKVDYTLNSVKVVASKNKDFTNEVSTTTTSFNITEEGKIEVVLNGTEEDSYYNVVFNYSNSNTKNAALPISKVEFYAVSGPAAPEYSITIPEFENGKVIAQVGGENVTQAPEGAEVTLVPTEGSYVYEVSDILVKLAKSGDEIKFIVDDEMPQYTFVMPAAAVTVDATFTRIPPVTVKLNHVRVDVDPSKSGDARYDYTIDCGTYEIKCNEETVSNETTLDVGSVLAFSYETTDQAYRFKSWAVSVKGGGTSTFKADAQEFTNTYTIDKTKFTAENREITINCTFEKIPMHTITFSINGVTSQEDVEDDTEINFPVVGNIGEKIFLGWSETAIEGETDDVPTLINTENLKATKACTYYAVFASKTSRIVTESYGWENSDDLTKWTISSSIDKTEASANYAANTGSYYGLLNSNSTVQFKNKVDIKEFSYYCVRRTTNTNTSIKIETSTDNSSWNSVESTTWGTFNSDGKTYKQITHTWENPVNCYVRLNITTAANRQLDDISITYSETTYSGYCTTVVTLESVLITNSPAKINYYVGDQFDPTGLIIKTAMSDGSTPVIEYNSNSSQYFEFTPSLATALQTSHSNVAVKYKGVDAAQGISISVTPRPEFSVTGLDGKGTETNPILIPKDAYNGTPIQVAGNVNWTVTLSPDTYSAVSNYTSSGSNNESVHVEINANNGDERTFKFTVSTTADVATKSYDIYIKQAAGNVTTVALATPTGLSYNNTTKQLTWNAVTTDEVGDALRDYIPTYEIRIDEGDWVIATSPYSVASLSVAAHKAEIRAKGNDITYTTSIATAPYLFTIEEAGFIGTIASWTSSSTNSISNNAWSSKGSTDMCGTTAAKITLKNTSADMQSITSQTVGSGSKAWYLVYGSIAASSYWDIEMTTNKKLSAGTKIKVVAYMTVNSKGITSWTASFNNGSTDNKMGDDITVIQNGAPSSLADMTLVEREITLSSDIASGTTIHVKLVASTGSTKNGRLSNVSVSATE